MPAGRRAKADIHQNHLPTCKQKPTARTIFTTARNLRAVARNTPTVARTLFTNAANIPATARNTGATAKMLCALARKLAKSARVLFTTARSIFTTARNLRASIRTVRIHACEKVAAPQKYRGNARKRWLKATGLSGKWVAQVAFMSAPDCTAGKPDAGATRVAYAASDLDATATEPQATAFKSDATVTAVDTSAKIEYPCCHQVSRHRVKVGRNRDCGSPLVTKKDATAAKVTATASTVPAGAFPLEKAIKTRFKAKKRHRPCGISCKRPRSFLNGRYTPPPSKQQSF